MTDILTAEADPEALRRELIRLFAEPKNLHHIVSAGLDGVRRQLAELRNAIESAENGGDQVVDVVAKLANLVRQEQRKHGGAVAQARKEHQRADAALTLLAKILREFQFGGHPGEPCVRTAWIPVPRVVAWRAAAEQLASSQPAEQTAALGKMEQRWQGAVTEARNHKARADRLAAELATVRGQVGPVRAQVWEARSQATTARGEVRDAKALHEQELRARSKAEIGWREALAQVERLRAELADYQLAASETRGAVDQEVRLALREAAARIYAYFGITPGILGAYGEGGRKAVELVAPWAAAELGVGTVQEQRLPQSGDRVRVTLDGELTIDPSGFGDYVLTYRPGPMGTEVGYFRLPPSATITVLGASEQQPAGGDSHEIEIAGCTVRLSGTNAAAVADQLRAEQAAPCWCGHDPDAHVTDDGDNAACRDCLLHPHSFRKAFHVHAPEQQ